jgi:hypothetical protein
MYLKNYFNHQIYPSDLPVLFKVINIYRSILSVLFMIRNKSTTEKVVENLLTLKVLVDLIGKNF